MTTEPTPTAAELLERPLLRPCDVAIIFDVSYTTASTWMSSGYIPAFRVGERALRITSKALKEWIDSRPPAGEQGVFAGDLLARRAYNRRDRT